MASQLVDERFETEVNCQSLKLLGQENFNVAGGTGEMESVGETAWAVHATAKTHNEKQKRITPDVIGLGNWMPQP
jgi:hypothetical protein